MQHRDVGSCMAEIYEGMNGPLLLTYRYWYSLVSQQ